MPQTIALSSEAIDLLRLHYAGGSLMMGQHAPEALPDAAVEETRSAYRELVAAGLMEAIYTFAHGRESRYHLTMEAMETQPECARGSIAPPLRLVDHNR